MLGVMRGAREEWSSTVVLGDGETGLIRPLTPEDRDALLAFHERQSVESKYRRFFSAKPTLSTSELDHFTNIDFVDRVALVIELHDEFIGWASYERWPNRDDAEAAFMVDDAHQGKGIATLLLEHLAAIARSNGIRRFTAEVLADNRAMTKVFTRAGWPLQRRFDSGVIDFDFDLEDTTEFVDSVERREQRADSRGVARLLLPRTIAVIGASDREGTVGHALWTNTIREFSGACYPVNPRRDTVGGHRSFPDVASIPDDINLAVIAVPNNSLEAAIDDCIAARVRGAVVVTSVDDANLDMGELVQRARRHGLRLIGPASMGIASPLPEAGLSASLVDVPLPSGGVAISMQSGTLGTSLLRLAGELQMGISWFVSLGDKCDVSGNDLLQFWLDDEATTVVAIYTESFGNPRKFARIARRVSQDRPIVAVRTGAALIGAATGALYQQAGVIEVPTVVAMLDTARVLATQPPMTGDRVAVITNSRSPGVLAAAALATAGLEAVAPPLALDWRADGDAFADAVRAAQSSDEIEAVMVIHAPPVASAIGGPVDAIDRAAAEGSKPLVAVMLGELDGPLTPGSPVPRFTFPEPAAAVLGRLRSYWRWRENEGVGVPEAPLDLDVAGAGRLIADALDHDRATLDVDDVRALLSAYGIHMAVAKIVPIDEAVTAANEVGYPVAVKATRRRPGHSARSGVALDVNNADDLATDLATMREHLGDDAAHVMVQKMVSPGVDLRVHVTADGPVGPVVTVGLGGSHADVIADEVSRLAPVATASAATMIASTRAAELLDEADTEATIDVVVRTAQLASDHPEIVGLDLNPVIVSGGACRVTDATAMLRRPVRSAAALRRLE
jgi:acyl-CoA synthetase (NDP forming)/RimJ/RimL family protein N-acetyltransferase